LTGERIAGLQIKLDRLQYLLDDFVACAER